MKTTDTHTSAPHVTRQRPAVRHPAHSPSAWPACSTNEHRHSPGPTQVKTTDTHTSAPHVTRQRPAIRHPAHSPSAWPACSTNEHRHSPDLTQLKTTDSRTSASHSTRLPPSIVRQHPEDDIPPTIKPCTAISNSKGMLNEPTIPPRHSPHQYQAVLDLIWPQIKTMAWRGHNDFADKYMMIRKTGLPNYLSARQQLVSNLNYDAWDSLLTEYHDRRLACKLHSPSTPNTN